MVRAIAVALAATVFLLACGQPAPPTLVPSMAPSPTGPATAPPAARVSIEASGLVGCDWMLGCGAIVDIEPEGTAAMQLDEAWRPTNPILLAMDPVPEADEVTFRIGPPLQAPPPVAPGTYRVVGAWFYADDVPSAEPTSPDISSVPRTCVTILEVEPATRRVSISVAFTLDGTCAIAASAA